MKARLIVGCGYLGHRIAQRWLARGDLVYALTRRAQRAASLQGDGIQPIIGDVTHRETLAKMPDVETVLYAVGHYADSGQSQVAMHVGGLTNVLETLPPTFERFIYISSTGVYGDSGGEWVDEETTCHPQRAAGKACLAAETTLECHPLANRAVILRLAGLYGPGRIPRKEVLLAGEAIDSPQHGYLNLIHVDDAVEVVLAATEADLRLPRRYLITDGTPVVRSEYYAELARLLGAPPPRFRLPSAETPAQARAAADKRVSNARMLSELKMTLLYPSYRQGLKAIISGSGC